MLTLGNKHNTMKNIFKVLLATVLVFSGTACDDEFLETVPLSQGTVDTFFQTEEDVVRAVSGVYDVFQGSIWGGAFYIMNTHFDILTDNAVGCCPWEYEYSTIAQGLHNPTTGGIMNNKWDFGYEGIFRVNSILENIDGVEFESEETRTALIAEVRFLRGMIQGELTHYFGDVPLVTSVIGREEGLELTRTPEAEVLTSVYADLDFAEQNLGMTPFNGDQGRPTMMSAIAVKTRYKLYNEDYQGAMTEAQKLMDIAETNPDLLGLVDEYDDIFSTANENNPEVLFDIQYKEGTEGEGNFVQVMLSPGPEGSPGRGWGSITPLDGLVNAFETIDGFAVNFDPVDSVWSSASPTFDPASPFENRDPRLLANLYVPGISTFRGEVYDEALSGFSPYFAVRKGVDESTNIGEDACACNENNFILYRYADILLMYAEASNEMSGPSADAIAAVNAVRNRAGMPDLPAGLDQAGFRAAIRQERHVEFPWEGTRWFDLIRWRTAETVVVEATLFGQSMDDRVFDPARHYLWPIPQKERDANPNLSQNDGF